MQAYTSIPAITILYDLKLFYYCFSDEDIHTLGDTSLERQNGEHQLLENQVATAVSGSDQRPRVSESGERHTEVEHMDTFTVEIGLWLGLKVQSVSSSEMKDLKEGPLEGSGRGIC